MIKILSSRGPYDLRAVVFSHGWADLTPFCVLAEDGTTEVAVRTKKTVATLRISPAADGLRIEADDISDEVIQAIRWIFRLDDDLTEFYTHTAGNDRPWIGERKMGRLLRSQTVFEDLIKLILTTNCSWAFTRLMIDQLMKELGDSAPDGSRAFPTPAALAGKTEKFFRTKIRAGYRSPHLRTIGRAIVNGNLDPEKWRDPSLPTENLRKEILSVPGAGPYVADNLLKFLGRYEYLGLDSWARGTLKRQWGMKKIPSDKTIARRYKPHGSYQGLVLWCDLTRDWLESEDFSSWIRTPAQTGAS
ncbi:MAG TPA: hypothetical protein VI895_04645 [Bdellovibrionota bacterium]|nr:hypothetical protein [Bdellovibrionota bacterium]